MLEYDAFVGCGTAGAQHAFPRAVLLKGFEALAQVGLVNLAPGRARAQLAHAHVRLAVSAEELCAHVRAKADCPTLVQRWACSSVDAVVN